MRGKGGAALGLAAIVSLCAPAAAGAATKTVQSGPYGSQAAKFQQAAGDANAYFRKVTTIHRGDSVRWKINGFHSVTFAPPGGPRPGLVAPDTNNNVSGSNDAAGQPFWFNGQPKLLLNLQGGAAPAGGKTFDPAVLMGSGLPLGDGPPPDYKLEFKRAGTFHYFCVVHHGMTGTIEVRKRGRPIASAAKDRKEAKRQQKVNLQRVLRLSSGLGTEDLQKAIQAGNDRRSGATVFKFFPANPRFSVGDTVTLQMAPGSTEDHTLTLGPSNGNEPTTTSSPPACSGRRSTRVAATRASARRAASRHTPGSTTATGSSTPGSSTTPPRRRRRAARR